MKSTRSTILHAAAAALALTASTLPAFSQSLLDQWRQGLAGSLLTAYKGSVVSNNSTLTVIRFCRDGRYSYRREGSWTAGGYGGGANASTITGRWDVRAAGGQVVLVYRTDQGQQGSFPMYLQANGRVNIGGLAYAVQRGGAGC
jgi:hypothetical protein